MDYLPFSECFTSECNPCSQKEEETALNLKINEYFDQFLQLTDGSIEDLFVLQEKGEFPQHMLLNHELVNKYGEAKKIYRVFTKDPTKPEYHGVGWVVKDSFPCCMVCNSPLLLLNDTSSSGSSKKDTNKRKKKKRKSGSPADSGPLSEFLPVNCFACGNIVCKNFCSSEAHISKLTKLGPLPVCVQCHWGQEVVDLSRTFRPLSLVENFADFVVAANKDHSSHHNTPSSASSMRSSYSRPRVPSSAVKTMLLDDEQLTFNLPPIETPTVDMTEHSYNGSNSEEESIDGDAVITEGGIIDLTKKRIHHQHHG